MGKKEKKEKKIQLEKDEEIEDNQKEVSQKKKKKKNKKRKNSELEDNNEISEKQLPNKKQKLNNSQESQQKQKQEQNITQEKNDKKKKKNKQDQKEQQQNKEQEKQNNISEQQQQNNINEQQQQVEYPYEVDKEDHCETPLQAYKDILPILLSTSMLDIKKPIQDIKIYDPYFCQGRMVENLKSLGFNHIYNKKEDFYKVIENNKIPEYDILITNPPYSEDHIQKILEFCVKQNKPWFLLVPNYVYTKDYYLNTMKLSEPWCKPFYVTPNDRYFYLKENKQTSPFVSFWYIYLPNQSNNILEQSRKLMSNSQCQIIKNLQKLPQNMKDSNDPTRKKLRKNQRDQKKKQQHQKQQQKN